VKDWHFRGRRAAWTENRFSMCDAKSREYTRGNADDRLCNFKRMGEETAQIADPTFRAWAIYFLKHIDAVFEYLKSGKEGTEGIEGRIDDAQNYLDLLRGLIEEKKGAGPSA